MLWVDCWFFMDGFVVFSLTVITTDSTWQETNGSTGKRNCSLFSLLSLVSSWYDSLGMRLPWANSGVVVLVIVFFPIHSCMQPDHYSFHAQQPGVHGCLVSWVCGRVFLYSQLVGVWEYYHDCVDMSCVLSCVCRIWWSRNMHLSWPRASSFHWYVCVCMFVCVCVIYACAYACDWECCRFLLRLVQERYLASLMPLKRDVSPWRVRHHAERYTITHSLYPPSPPHTHTHTHAAPTPVKAIQRRTISEGYGGGGATLDVWDQGKLGRTLQVHVHDSKSSWYIMCVDLVCLHYLSKLAIHLALLP